MPGMKCALALALLAIASIGCGGTESVTDSDASIDAGLDAALVPDGPLAFCSLWCGEIHAAYVPDGAGSTQQCAPGEICGESGGVAGFGCCDPVKRPMTCRPGGPENIDACR